MSMHLMAVISALKKQIDDLQDRLSVVESALLDIAAKLPVKRNERQN